MSEPTSLPLWLRKKKAKAWWLTFMTFLSLGVIAGSPQFGVSAVVLNALVTLSLWASYRRDFALWDKQLRDRSDDLRQ